MDDIKTSQNLKIYGVALGLLIAVVLIPSSGSSATVPAASGCGSSLKDVHYSAIFEFKTPLRIKIGNQGKQIVATISDVKSGTCQAVCEGKFFRQEGGFESPLMPVSMQLSCNGSQFQLLSSPVTLFWASAFQAQPELRFGTWINGYEQVALNVEYDAWSKPQQRAGSVAQAASSR